MPHNYCYHSKKSKLIYFEFSSHCLVWLASRLEPAREPPPSRAEPDFLARKNSEPSPLAEPNRAEPSSARLGSFPALPFWSNACMRTIFFSLWWLADGAYK